MSADVVVITPGYYSHYVPINEFLKKIHIQPSHVVVATTSAMKNMVEDDGHIFYPLKLWRSENNGVPEDQVHKKDKKTMATREAIKKGMVSALSFQAYNRFDDLFRDPEETRERIKHIQSVFSPRVYLVVQLCYNATMALEQMNLPYVTFVTGHPYQMPFADEVYGFPYAIPSKITYDNKELAELYHLCMIAQEKTTKAYNELMQNTCTQNVFSVNSNRMVVFNYPEIMINKRYRLEKRYYFANALVRDEEIDNNVDEWMKKRNCDLPLIYISFGTVLSYRGDVLKKIFNALKLIECDVVIARGVLEDKYILELKSEWLVLSFAPQIKILRHCNLLICHGGNNSITEAMNFGVPTLVFPFVSDQFFSAICVEEEGVGKVLDPNNCSEEDIYFAILESLDCKKRAMQIQQFINSSKNIEKIECDFKKII